MAYRLRERKPAKYTHDDDEDDSYIYRSRRSHYVNQGPAATASDKKGNTKKSNVAVPLNVVETYHPDRVTINPPSADTIELIEKSMMMIPTPTIVESPSTAEAVADLDKDMMNLVEEEEEAIEAPHPKVSIELDDLIPILTHRATLLDKQDAFTGNFKGHMAQLKRDLYMYLMGVAGKIPKKWDWAASQMIEETKERYLKQNMEYQSFLEMANKFGFSVNQEAGTISTATPKASSTQAYKMPSFNPETNGIVDILMSKYHIEDNGRLAPASTVQDRTEGENHKKRKLSSITPKPTALDQQKKFQTFFSNNQEFMSVDKSSKNAEEEEEEEDDSVPAFLRPINK